MTDITSITQHSEDHLINKLRKVSLRNQPDKLPYKDAYISVEELQPTSLSLAQNYVLKPELDKLTDLYYRLQFRAPHDILHLPGQLVIDYVDGESVGIIPPVIEECIVNGKIYHIIADGQHRCYLAYLWHSSISVVLIRGINKKYPYYAYPKQNQDWNSVEIRQDLPEDYMKKAYVQKNHKELFRDFVPEFQNLSVGRGTFSKGIDPKLEQARMRSEAADLMKGNYGVLGSPYEKKKG